jgi:hypothetical protein
MIRMLLPLVLFVVVAGCTKPAPPKGDMRSQLDAIATQCQLPPSVFEIKPPDDLHFRPSPDARYEDVDCAISALRKANLPLKLGFVGNEAYTTGNGQ